MKLLFLSLFSILYLQSFSQNVVPLSSQKDLDLLRDSKKGKVVLVNFWATWCKPCVSEFSELVKLYNDYRDRDFELVFISVDAPEEIISKVKPFLNQKGVDFTTYYNNFDKPEELMDFFDKQWGGAIPSTYVYNKSWNLTSSMLGRKTYDLFEKEILKDMD